MRGLGPTQALPQRALAVLFQSVPPWLLILAARQSNCTANGHEQPGLCQRQRRTAHDREAMVSV